MKNKINNKLLVLSTLTAISLSGCASKTIEIIEPSVSQVTVPQVQSFEIEEQRVSTWREEKTNSKEDCVDCYAKFVREPVDRVALVNRDTTVYGYDYAENKMNAYSPYAIEEEEYENPYEDENNYLVDSSYRESDYHNKSLYSKLENNPRVEENGRLLAKNSIQVGAFRKYAGAKLYAKRYSLLSSKYNVDIKANVKNNEPIYRVQIEGFSNEREAKDFMQRYGLDGAFLVRR